VSFLLVIGAATLRGWAWANAAEVPARVERTAASVTPARLAAQV